MTPTNAQRRRASDILFRLAGKVEAVQNSAALAPFSSELSHDINRAKRLLSDLSERVMSP